MFKTMSLQKKLLSLSFFMAVLLGGVAGVGYHSLSRVDGLYAELAEARFPNIIALLEVESAEKTITLEVSGMSALKPDDEEFAASEKRYSKALSQIQASIQTYEKIPFLPGEEESWKKAKAPLEAGLSLLEGAAKRAKQGGPSVRKEMDDLLQGPLAERREEFRILLDKHQEFLYNQVKNATESAGHTADLAYWTVGIGALAGILTSLLLGYFVSRGLARSLAEIANRLMAGSRQVTGATNAIADAGADLSSSSTQQAAALQETVASLEQVSAMVNKSADNARRSLENSAKSQEAAGKGKRAVEEMIGSIGEINRSNGEIMQQIEQSNREIAEIVKVIGEIGNKTKVINDIVFQTKLLSFNASVEAARAGEHGKGFAVVAEEVGNLAQMSGNAAKEISGMLDESMRKVQAIADGTKAKVEKLVVVGREKIETGSLTANRCAEVLDEIVENVAHVNRLVDEISTACREQAQGVSEINKAMGQLDQVTQQNSSAAQQSATAAEQLRGQVTDLDSVVATLRATLDGARSAGTESATALPAPTPDNVVAMKAARKAATAPTVARPKKVVGGSETPSADDTRFEDV